VSEAPPRCTRKGLIEVKADAYKKIQVGKWVV
jgi:hypothetical protein